MSRITPAQNQQDHVYHVLENDRAPRGVDAAKLTSNSDSSASSDCQTPLKSVPSGILSEPPSQPPPPPYRRHSAAPTSMPVYDDVIPRKFRPSLVPSTPTHPPTTPPKLPPPRGSKLIRCDSEESPPELPPRYRDSVVLALCGPPAPLYDDVHPSDPAPPVHNRLSIQIEDSPAHLPPPRSDTESPPPLPPPYRDSDVQMLLYDEVIHEESQSSTTDNQPKSSGAVLSFSSPFLTLDSPPQEAIIYEEINELSANTQKSRKDVL